jgi:integrase
MNEATEKAKIPKNTLHGLRHSIQTALRGGGVNPELLRATFGWTTEDVQEGYTHRELYDLTPQREATDTLFGNLIG